jgi:hypothetical protein
VDINQLVSTFVGVLLDKFNDIFLFHGCPCLDFLNEIQLFLDGLLFHFPFLGIFCFLLLFCRFIRHEDVILLE